MKTEDESIIFEYMNWAGNQPHIFDGDDIITVKNIMKQKGDWDKFFNFTYQQFFQPNKNQSDFFFWLFESENFFNLVLKWLQETTPLPLKYQGSKCPQHHVFYQTEYMESCHKTIEFCPQCRKNDFEDSFFTRGN
jgi:hypothetical protein